MGSQRVGHEWATEQQKKEENSFSCQVLIPDTDSKVSVFNWGSLCNQVEQRKADHSWALPPMKSTYVSSMEKASTTQQPQGKLPSPFHSWKEILVLQAVRHEAHGFFTFPQRGFISGHSVRKDSTGWQIINKKVFSGGKNRAFCHKWPNGNKFGKLSSGHRTGKGQFTFQCQRKAIPKNAQTTTQWHSSHS